MGKQAPASDSRARGRPAGPPALRVAAGAVTVESTRPSLVGGATWSALAGPWEIDFSYASMRAVEAHPFNDSTGPRTFWWLLRREGWPVGAFTGYVTETYNFATLFMTGPMRVMAAVADAAYQWLNEHGLYRRLNHFGLARFLRISSGRSRVMLLGGHTADVGGQVIGEALREEPAATYLPAIIAMIEAQARALGVEQVTFRETAESGAGPLHYPNLWAVRGTSGRRLLQAAGYRRDPGFPPGYVDLRDVQALFPDDGSGVYAFYRHEDKASFVAYESARRAWLAAVSATPDAGRGPLPVEVVLQHPHLALRTDETRLHGFRINLFRGGLLPDALVTAAQLDRAERGLKSAPRTLRRVQRLRSVQAGLQRRVAEAQADLPSDASGRAWLLAGRAAAGEGPVDRGAVRALAAAHEEERRLAAQVDPRFSALPSAVRSKYTQLVAGRIRHEDLERQHLLTAMGWRVDAPAAERARIEAAHEERLALARSEGGRDRDLRRARTAVAELVRQAGIRAEDAPCWAEAYDILDAHGGQLPAAAGRAAEHVATLQARLDEVTRSIAAGDEHLRREAATIGRYLLGRADGPVRDELEHARRAGFRREQDRIATEQGGGRRPANAAERRARLEAVLRYRPVAYADRLRKNEALRDTDRERLVREHEAHQARVRRAAPDQPGPDMPEFDDEGYLAAGLHFTGRDERVWTNLADQDRITALYHRTMAASKIRHDVEDWPYRAAYRAAGRETGDEIHISTLRAGGPTGPIVAAVSLKRSPAGHFRPERIAKSGHDFGAYYSLVFLVMEHEVARGGTWCSLGQTSQGTKMREFGAEFIDVREYTRFRGLVPLVFGFDLIRRRAFRQIHVDRILEIAAMRPEDREEWTRRHGIRWHI